MKCQNENCNKEIEEGKYTLFSHLIVCSNECATEMWLAYKKNVLDVQLPLDFNSDKRR